MEGVYQIFAKSLRTPTATALTLTMAGAAVATLYLRRDYGDHGYENFAERGSDVDHVSIRALIHDLMQDSM